MTLFDMIVLGALVLSGFAGFRKGGIREMVGFVGFTAALLVAAYALPWSAPVMRNFIHPDWAGASAALVAVFVAVYIVIFLLSEWLASQIDESLLGGFDRLIGLGFGLVRVVVLLGLFVLIVSVLPASMAPRWITGSMFYPLGRAAARLEAALAPKGFAISNSVSKTIGDKVKSGFGAPDGMSGQQPAGDDLSISPHDKNMTDRASPEQSPPLAPARKGLHTPRHSSQGGYSPSERRAIDALVEKSR